MEDVWKKVLTRKVRQSTAENLMKKAWLKHEKEIAKDAPECTCSQPSLENTVHHPGCPLLNYWVRKYMEFDKSWRENRL